jgi:hypothetical protein
LLYGAARFGIIAGMNRRTEEGPPLRRCAMKLVVQIPA